MQSSFKNRRSLAELALGEHAILDHIDLPADLATRLMELGFVPGSRVTAAAAAPAGDPQVFRVDGSDFALRKETARHLRIRHSSPTAQGE